MSVREPQQFHAHLQRNDARIATLKLDLALDLAEQRATVAAKHISDLQQRIAEQATAAAGQKALAADQQAAADVRIDALMAERESGGHHNVSLQAQLSALQAQLSALHAQLSAQV